MGLRKYETIQEVQTWIKEENNKRQAVIYCSRIHSAKPIDTSDQVVVFVQTNSLSSSYQVASNGSCLEEATQI